MPTGARRRSGERDASGSTPQPSSTRDIASTPANGHSRIIRCAGCLRVTKRMPGSRAGNRSSPGSHALKQFAKRKFGRRPEKFLPNGMRVNGEHWKI